MHVSCRAVERAAQTHMSPEQSGRSTSDFQLPAGRSHMKAIRFNQYGAVDVLEVVDAPVPEPGQGEALIKVKATSINPGEAKIREGLLRARWPATFPSGEGSDFAGIVTKVGPGVGSVKVGDEVIGFTEKRTSHAEY